jgi:hypothetical protein
MNVNVKFQEKHRSVEKLLGVANTLEHDGKHNVLFFLIFVESRLQDMKHIAWHAQQSNEDMTCNGANL